MNTFHFNCKKIFKRICFPEILIKYTGCKARESRLCFQEAREFPLVCCSRKDLLILRHVEGTTNTKNIL